MVCVEAAVVATALVAAGDWRPADMVAVVATGPALGELMPVPAMVAVMVQAMGPMPALAMAAVMVAAVATGPILGTEVVRRRTVAVTVRPLEAAR